ncbi:SWIM zinc finger family protein [Herbidospora sp. NBRC 101105]|uniref:SWIM zinc finger family protein n=1 Tax=Herbidospora sp. NBRC 101105 TaxID=3032195 RepID=UPI0024A3BBBC|nr:SWIM zinc finger family protein [Herbidospora sp. NBRC 101105]GLX94158.1 hypothetical protein Hesp01_21080 [Herbidospora sp. NBRC 101105]
MSPVGKDGWFEAGTPIKVEGGIRARGRRGTIGEKWWSRRFVDILERVCDPGRLARGRAYARQGQVVSMTVRAGSVEAVVQGSRPEPYRVEIEIEAYGQEEWAELERVVAGQAGHRARLLAGEMPKELDALFAGAGYPLFPEQGELEMTCGCPDWGNPCKHLSAVLYLLAEAFDDDPFLVLAWRGKPREQLLDDLRTPADEPLEDRLADFYALNVSAARLKGPRTPDTPPDLLLRALEPPKVKVRHIPLLDLLRPAYRSFTGPEEPPGDA